MVSEYVDAFVYLQTELLKLEKAAEMEESRRLTEDASLATLERRGVALIRMGVKSTKTGMCVAVPSLHVLPPPLPFSSLPVPSLPALPSALFSAPLQSDVVVRSLPPDTPSSLHGCSVAGPCARVLSCAHVRALFDPFAWNVSTPRGTCPHLRRCEQGTAGRW